MECLSWLRIGTISPKLLVEVLMVRSSSGTCLKENQCSKSMPINSLCVDLHLRTTVLFLLILSLFQLEMTRRLICGARTSLNLNTQTSSKTKKKSLVLWTPPEIIKQEQLMSVNICFKVLITAILTIYLQQLEHAFRSGIMNEVHLFRLLNGELIPSPK